MVALIIILFILLLLLILPVGIDAEYEENQFTLKLKIAFIFITAYPKKQAKKEEKNKSSNIEKKAGKKRNRFERDDISSLIQIGLKALHRFRIHLSIDQFSFRFSAGSSDPYDTVLKYGKVNAVICSVQPLAHSVLHIYEEDIQTAIDFETGHDTFYIKLVTTIQIWEILFIAICAGASFLRWCILKKIKNKRQQAIIREV